MRGGFAHQTGEENLEDKKLRKGLTIERSSRLCLKIKPLKL
jgi:hypothetical protein